MELSCEDDADLEMCAVSYPQRKALEDYAMSRFELSKRTTNSNPLDNQRSVRHMHVQMMKRLEPDVIPWVIKHLFGIFLAPAQNRRRFLTTCSSANLEVLLDVLKDLQRTCADFVQLASEFQNSMMVLGSALEQILEPIIAQRSSTEHDLRFDPLSFLEWADAFSQKAFNKRCVDMSYFWEGLCKRIVLEARNGIANRSSARRFLCYAVESPVFSMQPFHAYGIFDGNAEEDAVTSAILHVIFD